MNISIDTPEDLERLTRMVYDGRSGFPFELPPILERQALVIEALEHHYPDQPLPSWMVVLRDRGLERIHT